LSARSHVLIFDPRFAPLVEAGTKRQTIRPLRKRPIAVGDTLSLRTWSGASYRSKQRILHTGRCSAVRRIIIDLYWCDDATARADGFENAEDLLEWMMDTYDLPTPLHPFRGDLIQWAPEPCTPPP
jgi:hypothetical protein